MAGASGASPLTRVCYHAAARQLSKNKAAVLGLVVQVHGVASATPGDIKSQELAHSTKLGRCAWSWSLASG